jgi:hypothetical protein
MLCAYNCYRKRACVRDGLGSVKCIDFEVIFAVVIIVAVIICVAEGFMYGLVGLVVFLLCDILWFIIRDIEGVDTAAAESSVIGVSSAQV